MAGLKKKNVIFGKSNTNYRLFVSRFNKYLIQYFIINFINTGRFVRENKKLYTCILLYKCLYIFV